ncbi:MAG: hypothetical protein ACJAT4_003324 [Granulosicoccus sp.]|jgi:hypothetical protein
MFQSKIITKNIFPDLPTVMAEIEANPNKKYSLEATSFNFPGTKIKELLQKECRILINSDDIYSENQINEFITLGKALVSLQPKGFAESKLLNYLDKGASTVVSRADGFDVFQITKLVDKGKERTTVVGGKNDFTETHIQNYLKAGACVFFKKHDLTDYAITRLLPDGEDQVFIQGAKFTSTRVDIFLVGKAKVIFGVGNEFSQNRIKKKVTQFKSQTFIDSGYFTFDLPWVKEMQDLGANII